MDFFTRANSRVGGPWRCSTFRWCLKKDTSLVVVSMRSTTPTLSYILIEHVPKWCLMQVGRELRADLLGQQWRDLTAEEAGDLLGLHAQHRLPDQLLVERSEAGGGTECQIGGVFHL